MANLYELTAQAAQLYEMLQGEEIDEQTFLDTLEAMGVNDKVESYCKIIKQLQSDAEMYGAEIARLKARKKTAENGIERMREALLTYLEMSGQDKVKAGTFSVSVSQTQKLSITEGAKIPPEYLVIQPPEVDKNGLKKAIKGGAVFEGIELVTSKGVRIR